MPEPMFISCRAESVSNMLDREGGVKYFGPLFPVIAEAMIQVVIWTTWTQFRTRPGHRLEDFNIGA